MLRAARRAARRCPHVDALGSLEGGECYVCAAARAAEAEGEVLEDPLARIGREARARGSGKRVRFGGEVRVFGTWSRSEYPRRERDGQEHGEAEELGSSELGAGSSDELEGDGALGMMLQAREGTMAEAMWTWQTAPLKGPGPEESGSVITDSDGSSDLAVDWVAGSADVRPSIS
ncbi:hypothetical protein DFJ74DRAFT_695067 [Hyaloraphidium curvatum]|nr:hypothetical protein DFJ74DRAFT_695067 [Hyaloraphidium curvatum]